jgi:CRP-like cAMP-binding protein
VRDRATDGTVRAGLLGTVAPRYDKALRQGENVIVRSSAPVDKNELLTHIFPSLDSAAIDELAAMCLEVRHDTGELIAQEESYASGVYIVRSGLVKIGKYGSTGAEKRVLRFLSVGEMFGLEAVVLDHSTHVQYAKTLMETNLLFIERHNLLAFRNRYPELCTDFTRWLARDVVMLELKLTRDAVESVDRNLALLLLALAHNYGSGTEKGVVLDLPVPRRTLAEMLGVSVESLMRALKRFRDRKLLETSGRRVTITDVESLKERARITPFYLSIVEETL